MSEFSKTICPIWFLASKGYELEGSAVLLSIGQQRFLITAGHVLDRTQYHRAFIGLARGFIELRGIAKGTTPPKGNRQQDFVDLAFVALEHELSEAMTDDYAFLPVRYTDLLDEGHERTPYVVNGCPWKKVELKCRTFLPQLYHFRLTGRSHQEYPSLGISPLTHIALEFERNKLIDAYGKQVASPKPRGVSGGPVWKLVNTTTPTGNAAMTKRLVGITTDFLEAKRTLIATRISGVLAGLASTFPEIAGLVPHDPRLQVVCNASPDFNR